MVTWFCTYMKNIYDAVIYCHETSYREILMLPVVRSEALMGPGFSCSTILMSRFSDWGEISPCWMDGCDEPQTFLLQLVRTFSWNSSAPPGSQTVVPDFSCSTTVRLKSTSPSRSSGFNCKIPLRAIGTFLL